MGEGALGTQVRAFYANDRQARTVGRVIAYTDRPTFLIEMPDGTRETWLAELCEPAGDGLA